MDGAKCNKNNNSYTAVLRVFMHNTEEGTER